MTKNFSKTQTARLLASFIRYSNKKGAIADQKEFFSEVSLIATNGNALDVHLYELNEHGIVYYEEIGEDGFAPIIMVGCTERTAEYLVSLLQEIDKDTEDLKSRLSEILTFDPEKLKAEINNAEIQLKDARKSAEKNDLLKPLLHQISSIEKHFHSIATVADKYEDVYKNIIRPVQLEGESGVKATVRWAIIGIVASTLVSIVLGNWKDLMTILGNHP